MREASLVIAEVLESVSQFLSLVSHTHTHTHTHTAEQEQNALTQLSDNFINYSVRST